MCKCGSQQTNCSATAMMATWAFAVLPSGLSLRGPDMSLDTRLLVVSVETPGSDGSESMAVGLSGLLC